MKKYIATIENTNTENTFEVYFDTETAILSGLLPSGAEEEIYDMNNADEAISQFSDKEIVETVCSLYTPHPWEIVDCIEYED